MRPKPHKKAEKHRVRKGMWGSPKHVNFGLFEIPYGNVILRMIVSDGEGWDHVSVSLPDRCPTWEEMCFVKKLFWYPEDTIIQYHPPESEYVNNHPFCLHLWKEQGVFMRLPPLWMVGIKGKNKP